MAQKPIKGVAEVPEICRGFDINWADYDPPGGERWLTYYLTDLKPTFEKCMRDAEAELKQLTEIHVRQNAIRKGLEAASVIGQMIVELTNMRDNGISPRAGLNLMTWVEQTDAIAKMQNLFAVDDHHRTVDMIEEDIKYAKAVLEYFSKDFELDTTLYAMYKVDPKYKAKLFRHVIRLLKSVETTREIIRTSNSVIKTSTDEILKPVIETLDQSYSVLSVNLRKMKKEAAKAKPGFWETVI